MGAAQDITPILLSLLTAQLPFNPPTSIHQRRLTAELVRHLAPTLPFPFLALYCGGYQATNQALVRETIETALEETDELLEEFAQVGVGALEVDHGDGVEWEEWARRAAVHCGVARCCPDVSSLYGQSERVLVTLQKWYDTILPSYAPDSLSDSLKNPSRVSAHVKKEREWLSIKLEVLETIHAILAAAFLTPLADAQGQAQQQERSAFWDELEDVIGPLFRVPASSHQFLTRSLFNRSLLEDLETYFNMADKMERLAGGDARGLQLARKFRGLRKERGTADGLSLLEKLNASTSTPLGGGKGKGKAVEQSTSSDLADIDLSVSSILDILPSLSPIFIRACLEHPKFGGDSTKVIQALLEEDELPNELRRIRDGVNPVSEAVEPSRDSAPVKLQRNNIFDGEKLDKHQLRRGKDTYGCTTADAILLDRSFLTDDLRAAIIARAEAPSSDEEDDVADTEAFLEDFDDPARSVRIRDGGDVEDGDSEAESGANTPAHIVEPLPADPLANPITPQIASMLESTYIATPALFDRNSATRKSKERKALRERSGLADEQIEGWRIMFDRNPKKDKILAKHDFVREFTGNKVDEQVESGERAPQGPSRGGRGRGERGRGRGDGGRAAHDRRQRGNDRKMAKMGGV